MIEDAYRTIRAQMRLYEWMDGGLMLRAMVHERLAQMRARRRLA